jgi:hypothetical protein
MIFEIKTINGGELGVAHHCAVDVELAASRGTHNEKHIGRTFFGAVGFRPGRFGSLVRAANHAVEGGSGFVFF